MPGHGNRMGTRVKIGAFFKKLLRFIEKKNTLQPTFFAVHAQNLKSFYVTLYNIPNDIIIVVESIIMYRWTATGSLGRVHAAAEKNDFFFFSVHPPRASCTALFRTTRLYNT